MTTDSAAESGSVSQPLSGNATLTGAGAPEWDRLDWIARVWREVAQDYCSHEGVGKSCAKCRGVVSDVADLFQERTSE